MILQSQITLGGPMSDADINAAFDTFNTGTNQAQTAQLKAQAKQQAAAMTKIRGTITETYDNIETNKAFAADDFNYPVPRGVRLTPSPFGAAASTTSSTSDSASSEVNQRNACINNLRQIDGAKNEFALEKARQMELPLRRPISSLTLNWTRTEIFKVSGRAAHIPLAKSANFDLFYSRHALP